MSVDVSPENDAMRLIVSSGKVGAGTGVAGLTAGYVWGLFAARRPGVTGLAFGIFGAGLGMSFWASRHETLRWLTRHASSDVDAATSHQRFIASGIGGACGGAFSSLATGGRSYTRSAIFFSLVGLLGQATADTIHSVSVKHAAATYEDGPGLVQRAMSFSWLPMKRLSDSEYRDILQDRLVRIEADMAMLDEEIEQLRSNKPPN